MLIVYRKHCSKSGSVCISVGGDLLSCPFSQEYISRIQHVVLGNLPFLLKVVPGVLNISLHVVLPCSFLNGRIVFWMLSHPQLNQRSIDSQSGCFQSICYNKQCGQKPFHTSLPTLELSVRWANARLPGVGVENNTITNDSVDIDSVLPTLTLEATLAPPCVSV